MFPKPVEISIRRLKTNVLCDKHNRELGRTADAAALRLARALRQSNRPMELPGSRILRPPVGRSIRGVDFGRWLCKTHCNFMVAAGIAPASDFVRYSFQKPTENRLYFYFAGSLGTTVRFGDSRDPVVRYAQLLPDGAPDVEGCEITLVGFRTVVSNSKILRNNQEMIDRLVDMHHETPLGPFTIHFDWSGEV